MRRVHGTEAQVQVERLVRVDLLGVGDELHRPVDEILAEVVPLLGRLRRLDLVVVVDQIGIPLAGVTTEETVEALEATAERPAVVRAGRGLLVAGREVPLADHERVVTVAHQHLRQHPVLERHDPVVARVPGRQLGDARHRIGVVVATGDDARTTRRAQRRGVHVVVPQAVGRDRVEVRRGNGAPEATEIAEPGVIQHDHHNVGRSGACPGRRRPSRARFLGRTTDDTGKRPALWILDDRHGAAFLFRPARATSVWSGLV